MPAFAITYSRALTFRGEDNFLAAVRKQTVKARTGPISCSRPDRAATRSKTLRIAKGDFNHIGPGAA
ncbi:hypothetical protein ML401_07320 [Bradyrhizobium sp. 62B]|jgi:hypothetical protein|uniref:hypothetical protein n=1 Tax=unclassified Bradyrhizobium TaxID=2631580 RepID=UPI001BAADC4F|nr:MULTISPECIES: hypothetical protein [Bradyrhizobium]MBR0926502.1 hypothetical protein [Bradyrhizobium diazoefficiens]MDT4743574.1 hypothetical protein [Bradyrhizobium sp. WYCCWR 12699]WIW47916.1 hypothetical protein ML401_07320 [Bradyrhizobium sp. 62B]